MISLLVQTSDHKDVLEICKNLKTELSKSKFSKLEMN